MKKKKDEIGPLDIFRVGPKKYFQEFFRQLNECTRFPSKIRTVHNIFKEDIGYWPLFFGLISIAAIITLAVIIPRD